MFIIWSNSKVFEVYRKLQDMPVGIPATLGVFGRKGRLFNIFSVSPALHHRRIYVWGTEFHIVARSFEIQILMYFFL